MTTSYGIEGTSSVTLEINDTPLPPTQGLIVSCFIHCGFGWPVPYIELTLTDQQNLLTGKFAINDGTALTLVFGKRGLDNKIKCQVVTKKSNPSSVGVLMVLKCVLRAPAYAFGAMSESFNGTSVDALRELCNKAGLKFESEESTNDKMKWLNVGKSRAHHVLDIVSHSYKDDKSVMSALLDPFGTMRYVELISRLKKSPDYTIFSGAVGESKTGDAKTFVATEIQPISLSGMMNHLSNYGSAIVQPGMSGDIDTFDKIEAPKIGDGVAINQETHESFKYGRMDYAQYYDPGVGDIGGSNGHAKYLSAPYSNKRQLSLFSQCMRVLIDGNANIPLFSVVDLKITQVSGTQEVTNTADSGQYIVGGYTIAIKGLYFSEAYALYRCYVSDSGNTPVLGSKNQKASAGKPEMTEAANSSVDYKDPQNSKSISDQLRDKVRAAQDATNSGRANFLDTVNSPVSETQTALDKFVSDAEGLIDGMMNEFNAEGSSFGGLDFLSDKYGNGYDKIMALLGEFSSAKSTLENCGRLSPLQNMALNFVSLNLNGLIRMLEKRISKLDGLSLQLVKMLNAFLAYGDIDSTYLSSPSLTTNCKQFKNDHLNAAISNRFPDRCLDSFALERLRTPDARLSRLRRLLLGFLRNLFCMLGQDR